MKPQVIILAAGKSSRFFPYNHEHKCLRVLCGKPIIIHTLESIHKSGLDQVTIVVNEDSPIEKAVKNNPIDGLTVSFAVQKEALGMGNAVQAATDTINGPFFVIHSQHINFHLQAPSMLQEFESDSYAAVVVKASTEHPEKYGILRLNGDKVLEVVEKPSAVDAPSNQRIVGIYLFSQEFLSVLNQTSQAEYQFEAALTHMCRTHTVKAVEQTAPHPSLKYPWDLFQIRDQLLERLPQAISETASIAETALIKGDVIIEDGAQIFDYAIIEGPVYIGKNAVVGAYSVLRNKSVLEEGAQIQRYCDARNTLLGRNSHIHSEFLGDSIIGENCRMGAGFITANKRIDRANVKVSVKDKKVDCGQNSLGMIMGDSVKTGIRLATMPGTVIGSKSLVGPGLTIKGTFPEQSKITESNV